MEDCFNLIDSFKKNAFHFILLSIFSNLKNIHILQNCTNFKNVFQLQSSFSPHFSYLHTVHIIENTHDEFTIDRKAG